MDKKSVSNSNNDTKETLNKSVVKATKWSSITELAAKLVTPITTMVLARVLTPSAFGVMVTATIVISFAELFTDAGFQKYIVQHDFKDKDALYKSTNVAFISNLTMSILLWLLITIFSSPIAALVGNPGYGLVIAAASICIPIEAFSSIQMALYRRDFDFKTLFIVRMVGILIPIVVTIPLALIFRSYWALIGGMIALNLSNAIILTYKSPWKPRLWFSKLLFMEMFAFSVWSMIEAISIWLTSYIDMFLVGRMLNDYYLGLYRTSMSTVGQFVGIVTAATTPVLFSSLSRLQTDHEGFKQVFFKFQKLVALLVIPLGVGIFIFRNLITEILLGNQWKEAAYFIGLWGLTSAITIVLSHYSSECYRAKGRPKLSFIAQLLHIVVLIPAVIWAIGYGYQFLCEVRSFVRFELIIANMIFMAIYIKISPVSMVRNITPALIGGGGMILLGYLIPSSNLMMEIIRIGVCVLAYVAVIMIFPKERHILCNLKSVIKK